ncbi:MAG: ABC transporter permease [Acidimicrobiales bacterium]
MQVSVIGIIAIPGAMIVLAGYVDLSIGSVSVLSAIVFGQVAAAMHLSEVVALIAAIGAGAAWGLMNGLLIAYANFSAIVVTLGGLAGAYGLAEVLSGGITQANFSTWFVYIGDGFLGGLPLPVWILLGVVLIGAYVWYAMPYGRYFTAIGADRSTALSAGINVRRQILWLYVASGTAAAVGGIILASQLDAASLTIGTGEMLQVLTAILIGGVSFVGGRGSFFGVVTGVLFIGVLYDGLVLVNVNPFMNTVAVGGALVFAAGLDVLYRRLERVRHDDSRDEDAPLVSAVDGNQRQAAVE